MKKLVCVFLSAVLCLSCAACGNEGEQPDTYTADQSYIYGMDYIIYERLGDIDYVKGIELMSNMGVKSLRHWMHCDWFLDDELTVKQGNVDAMKEIIAELAKYDF